MSTTYLITGANRGIGLAYVDQLTQDASNAVMASVRSANVADTLKALKISNLRIILLDLTQSFADFETAFNKVDSYAPDDIGVLINKGGYVVQTSSKSS